MCLYPRLMPNKKYERTIKNEGVIPLIIDQRTRYVPRKCGNCMECRKQKAREWQVRLLEDIKENKTGKFITLTFSNESIKQLENYILLQPTNTTTPRPTGYALDNTIATTAVRLFLERYRKQHKKSLRHWLITELGHNGTENIHIHGIIWLKTNNWINELLEIQKIWSYGFMWKWKIEQGRKINYVNNTTIGYMSKYVTKMDEKHKTYKSKILASPGIGSNYIKQQHGDWNKNKYNGKNTIETYKTTTGHKIALPVYWRNKIYTDEEKEKLWINKLNKEERYILGNRIDVSKTQNEYERGLEEARKLNQQLGYGKERDKDTWKREYYEKQRRIIMQETRRIKTMPPAACFFKGKIGAETTK